MGPERTIGVNWTATRETTEYGGLDKSLHLVPSQIQNHLAMPGIFGKFSKGASRIDLMVHWVGEDAAKYSDHHSGRHRPVLDYADARS